MGCDVPEVVYRHVAVGIEVPVELSADELALYEAEAAYWAGRVKGDLDRLLFGVFPVP